MDPWWDRVRGSQLAQGDMLPDCVVPIMPADFVPPPVGPAGDQYDFEADLFHLIVVTQSCDLENDKAALVAACPIFGVRDYEVDHSEFRQKGQWEQVRRGRVEGLHLLASLSDPDDNQTALVVDFHQIYSLPIGYMSAQAAEAGPRFRLKPPYLEHFSQAFARFFMRVGLPSDIPRFR